MSINFIQTSSIAVWKNGIKNTLSFSIDLIKESLVLLLKPSTFIQWIRYFIWWAVLLILSSCSEDQQDWWKLSKDGIGTWYHCQKTKGYEDIEDQLISFWIDETEAKSLAHTGKLITEFPKWNEVWKHFSFWTKAKLDDLNEADRCVTNDINYIIHPQVKLASSRYFYWIWRYMFYQELEYKEGVIPFILENHYYWRYFPHELWHSTLNWVKHKDDFEFLHNAMNFSEAGSGFLWMHTFLSRALEKAPDITTLEYALANVLINIWIFLTTPLEKDTHLHHKAFFQYSVDEYLKVYSDRFSPVENVSSFLFERLVWLDSWDDNKHVIDSEFKKMIVSADVSIEEIIEFQKIFLWYIQHLSLKELIMENMNNYRHHNGEVISEANVFDTIDTIIQKFLSEIEMGYYAPYNKNNSNTRKYAKVLHKNEFYWWTRDYWKWVGSPSN